MKSLNILVIDDRMTDTEFLAGMLRRQGHNVTTAGDGYEGLEQAVSEQPDLILMDVVMPQLNGFQATRELSRNFATRDIPVIVISWKDEEADRIWALRQGARAYLNKDECQESLGRVITEVMEESRSRREDGEVVVCGQP
jgi:twitching motility two-component system response regulator PilH